MFHSQGVDDEGDAPGEAFVVLVAEDDPDARALLADALRRRGFHVIEVSDGSELLASVAATISDARDASPDVVVSDVHMPCCDGLTAAAEIHRTRPDLPVVLVSAFDDSAARSAAALAGAAAMLPKPVDTSTLSALVRSLGAARRALRAAPLTAP